MFLQGSIEVNRGVIVLVLLTLAILVACGTSSPPAPEAGQGTASEAILQK